MPGIGPRRRAALLVHFGSIDRIRRAAIEEVARVPGFSTTLAERVKAALSVVEATSGAIEAGGETVE